MTEVVVACDWLAAQVAHEGPAAARHAVTALRLHQPRPALHTLPDARRCHPLLAADTHTHTHVRGGAEEQTRTELRPSGSVRFRNKLNK